MPRQPHSSQSASPSDPPRPSSPSHKAVDPPSNTGDKSLADEELQEKDLHNENFESTIATTVRSRSSRRRISPKSTLVVRRVYEEDEEVKC